MNTTGNAGETIQPIGNAERVKYCINCGARNPFSNAVCSNCGSSNFSSIPRQVERPDGVVILAILGFLGGLVDIGMGVLFGALFPILFIVFAFIGILFLIASLSLLTGKNWARILMMIFSVLSLFNFPVGTILGIVFLYYFTRPHVVQYFKRDQNYGSI